MDLFGGASSSSEISRSFNWDGKYCVRHPKKYDAEDDKILDLDCHFTSQALIEKFCDNEDIISPPCHNHAALKNFLCQASLVQLASSQTPLALLDDRRDQGPRSAPVRDWESAEYLHQSLKGVDDRRSVLDEQSLYDKLRENRTTQDPRGFKVTNNAERRLLLLNNITPLCALVLAATVARRFKSTLRAYLQRHIINRVCFRVLAIDATFEMEFHIPYMAVRMKQKKDPRGLRKVHEMPEHLNKGSMFSDSYYHQAQVSFLLTGVDEWHWTAYCCVDTFFESEKTLDEYFKAKLDGLSGGAALEWQPTWNPREYFLHAFARRLGQATQEWTNVILELESRLDEYETANEKDIQTKAFNQDKDFEKIKRYTWALVILRRFHDSLLKTHEAWKDFASGELKYFETRSEVLDRKWGKYHQSLFHDISELVYLRRSLLQRIETFDRMKDGLVSASSLRESKNIRLLTNVTIAYLPFTLASGVFSMSMIDSKGHWIWWAWWILTIVALYLATFSIAFAPRGISQLRKKSR